MPKPYRLVLAFFLAGPSYACGKAGTLDFGGFYVPIGQSARAANGSITISTDFLDQLRRNPTGEELEKNRNELLYLLSINDEKAVSAGLAVLAYLIRNPSFSRDCDADHERFGKEEIAFALSRTDALPDELCRLDPDDRKAVVSLYAKHNELYSNFDPPWMPGNLACN